MVYYRRDDDKLIVFIDNKKKNSNFLKNGDYFKSLVTFTKQMVTNHNIGEYGTFSWESCVDWGF